MNAAPACTFCGKATADEEFITLVNPKGGYGRPEASYACDACLANAELGSRLDDIRELNGVPRAHTVADAIAAIERAR